MSKTLQASSLSLGCPACLSKFQTSRHAQRSRNGPSLSSVSHGYFSGTTGERSRTRFSVGAKKHTISARRTGRQADLKSNHHWCASSSASSASLDWRNLARTHTCLKDRHRNRRTHLQARQLRTDAHRWARAPPPAPTRHRNSSLQDEPREPSLCASVLILRSALQLGLDKRVRTWLQLTGSGGALI